MKTITNKLKLVIWDMDDTFWKGTISEGDVSCPPEHIALLKALVDNGIVNAICSNNDFEIVKAKLVSLGIWEYFVFPQINWQPKGPSIRKIIEDVQLRPDNTLFVDDRILNLEAAKFELPNLMVLDAQYIEVLKSYIEDNPKPDKQHTRLAHYKLLERKAEQRAQVESSSDFLKQSDIKIAFVSAEQHIDRIAELIERTNQLNFTKKRIEKPAVEALVIDKSVTCKAVWVKDKYGDYGICGFYALKQLSNGTSQLEHFVFSCRILNMGIEQHIYYMLGYPQLSTNSKQLDSLMGTAPDWIGEITPELSFWQQKLFQIGDKLWHFAPILRPALTAIQARFFAQPTQVNEHNILFQGGCTVNVLNAYMENVLPDILTDVSEWRASASMMRYQFGKSHDKAELESALAWTSDVQPTIDLSDQRQVLILDLAKDYRTAYYQYQNTDIYLPISPFHVDLTKKENWHVVKEWKQHLGSGPWWDKIYSPSGLKWLAKNCTYIENSERLDLFERFLTETIHAVKARMPNTKIILIDHSDIAPKDNFEVWQELPREITKCKHIVATTAKTFNVAVLDIGELVTSDGDFIDGNPFHFSRQIAFNASHKLIKEIQLGLSKSKDDATETPTETAVIEPSVRN
ncbi:HAD-IIIC family phosphatase [Pseudoalteromonas sp. MMG022]|uniref:HAD-IIIC family phosphatase n=1 Tax=Pseudoalteromonas sp. MMG022 TaxID=2909978 RepID=UPI001F328E00|nr:HAD-IIIC family phosphatase [Pseudoalteromonas sp. MMG022]MCF6436739.1 HAD-IIIC family phosphatase [Pseudoalteromonas sp. MMG022]